jgi:hypothetical protein
VDISKVLKIDETTNHRIFGKEITVKKEIDLIESLLSPRLLR